MNSTTRDDPQSLERFRSYLHLLARLRLQGKHQKRIDPGDMVQQTLFEAYQQRERYHGSTQAEMASWLRRILAHNLGQAFRALHRDEDTILDSPTRAGSPSDTMAGGNSPPAPVAPDSSVALAEALAQLPEAERESLVLQYWHGLTLAEIGVKLERSPVGVAGLLKRGLSRLRSVLHVPG